jgi:hypothetical protein
MASNLFGLSQPTNPWHPFQTRVDDGTPEKRTVNVIPRFATRVYFDCATAEQNAMEHNSIYGPDCVGVCAICSFLCGRLR